MIKYYLLILACCISLMASSQMSNEERAALHREYGRHVKPIIEAFENQSFTLTVNTLHPKGFYFNSYFKVKFLAATMTSSELFLQWEETIGADRTGDLEMTRKEVWLDLSVVNKYTPLSMPFQPNSNVDAKKMYAVIQFNTDGKYLIKTWETKYEVNNGSKNKISSGEKKVTEVFVPFMSLGDCTTCYTPEQLAKVISYITDYYKYANQ